MRTDLTLKDLPPMSEEEKNWWDEHNSEYCHYFYRIDNTVNGKFYYGIHSERLDSGKSPEEDGYMGSGTDLKKAQDEEGIENFKKTVIKTFSTRDEARLEEMKVVDKDLIFNPMCYNIALGGGGNCPGIWVTDGKISKKIYNDDDIPDGWRKGRTISDEYRAAMVKGSKVEYINRFTLESKRFTKDEIKSVEDDTWFSSVFFTESGRFIEYSEIQNIFNKTNSWNAVARNFNICIESVRKIRDYYISKGYNFTSDYKRTIPEDLGRWSSRMKDKVYINNGKEYKVINSNELNLYVSSGWKVGKGFLTEEEKENIINKFLETPSVMDISRKLHKSSKIIREALGFDGTEKIIWAHRGDIITRTKIPNKLLKRFYDFGWKKKKKIDRLIVYLFILVGETGLEPAKLSGSQSRRDTNFATLRILFYVEWR